ncbi:hypothetical protein ACQ4PT_044950 [Festuca glaucescens]
MTTVPGSLVWELVKKNNCFLIKQFGNSNAKVQFSKEPNNLYNVHSYKFSGLANSKTVTVQPSAGDDKAVVLSTTKTKKQNAPAKLQHKNVMRKDFRKMAKAVKNQVIAPEKCFSEIPLLCWRATTHLFVHVFFTCNSVFSAGLEHMEH